MHRNSRRCKPPWASIKALLLKEQYVHSSSPAAPNTGSQPKAVGTCVLSRSQVVCLSLPVGKLWTKALRSQFICFLLKAHWNEAYKRRQSIHNPLKASEPPPPDYSRLRRCLPDLGGPVWVPAPGGGGRGAACSLETCFPSDDVYVLGRVWLFATPRTGACRALSMGFSGQEYWSELPFSSSIFPSGRGLKGASQICHRPHIWASSFLCSC